MLSVGRDAEKVYLQSTIKTMEIWKDLDFWQAAIFTSLYKELLFKNSARNQADEHKNDSAENQNLIVTGLLMSFIHVMNDFEVERKSILIIIKQFNQYYSLGEATVKELEVFCSIECFLIKFLDYCRSSQFEWKRHFKMPSCRTQSNSFL